MTEHDYRVTRTISHNTWCEITADNKEQAKEGAIERDVWFGDDGMGGNYNDDEFEVEEV